MADIYQPRTEAELGEFIRGARAGGYPLEVCGFRSKRQAGRPVSPSAVVSTAKLTGITHYEPQELVMSARSGTPLHEIEAELAKKGQELAFEPADVSRIYGREALAASIGAVAAMNISGQRRILRGAARDHLLGLRAVNGNGEVFKTGGRVMKNVTGVDLVRGLAGSWGTLAVISEVTFKVLPIAPDVRTLLYYGLLDESAIGLMSSAMGTPYEVSGTLHLHAGFAARLNGGVVAPQQTSLTALRIEGPADFIASRVARLRHELAPFGDSQELDGQRSRAFWRDVRALSFLSDNFEVPLWRLTVAPSKAPLIVRALSQFFPLTAAYEWSGGLIWIETPLSLDANATEIRRVLAEYAADAMIMRAPRAVRENVEVFHPLPVAKMNIVKGLKLAFDPGQVLNKGRMYAGV